MTPTDQQLRQMFPNAGRRLDAHLLYIAPAMVAAAIDTPERIAAFLAQVAHESGEYRWLEEIADGGEYEGRADLGNTEPGDGQRFKAHGPIGITGRANHLACGKALGIDLIAEPRLICTPVYATASACWFWNTHQLSLPADRSWFLTITRIINGGFNGLQSRLDYWHRNRVLLDLPPVDIYQETEAVIAFQRERGLTADGAVGPKTLAALAA